MVEQVSSKSFSSVREAPSTPWLEQMEDAINNLCTSQPNPSRRAVVSTAAVSQKSQPQMFSCRHCSFSTRFRDERYHHIKSNHPVVFDSRLVEKLSKVTASVTNASTAGSYGERLTNILKPSSGETDWLGYDKDDSMFATPPNESPENESQRKLVGNSSYISQKTSPSMKYFSGYKRHQVGRTDLYKKSREAEIQKGLVSSRSGYHGGVTSAPTSASYSSSSNRSFGNLPVLTHSSKLNSVRQSGNVVNWSASGRDVVQGLLGGDKTQHSSLTMGTIDPSLIEIVSDSDDSMDY